MNNGIEGRYAGDSEMPDAGRRWWVGWGSVVGGMKVITRETVWWSYSGWHIETMAYTETDDGWLTAGCL